MSKTRFSNHPTSKQPQHPSKPPQSVKRSEPSGGFYFGYDDPFNSTSNTSFDAQFGFFDAIPPNDDPPFQPRQRTTLFDSDVFQQPRFQSQQQPPPSMDHLSSQDVLSRPIVEVNQQIQLVEGEIRNLQQAVEEAVNKRSQLLRSLHVVYSDEL